jgi:hypothetical protein
MSERAEILAKRIEQGANQLVEFVEGLSEEQWSTIVRPDGRRVGVLVHHVASVYPIEVHLASEIAAGKPVKCVTWDDVAEMNAKHALENAGVSRQEAVALLRCNSHDAAEAVRKFTDEQLDHAEAFSLNADAPLTAQFVIEDHALRHSWHHLAKIKAALQRQ